MMTEPKDNAEPSGASGGSLAWIPAAERMPEIGTSVLVFGDDEVFIGASWGGKCWEKYPADSSGDEYFAREVTHWMPLPAPPTGDK